MEKQYESDYHIQEDQHWWFKSRRNILKTMLSEQDRSMKILDVGCSSGIFLAELLEIGYSTDQLFGIDVSEEGIEKASSERPDLIILDHQLPGKTGYEVACELLKDAETAKIPVVASSTLRKKAYVEYVDCDNVVDMLPKPYTPEALVATVENAIDTGVMVVESQAGGTAVPEVIDEMGESDMTGNFACFSLREIIDMINNGNKKGVLTVENETCRVSIHVERGRIQAVTANGIDPQLSLIHI